MAKVYDGNSDFSARCHAQPGWHFLLDPLDELRWFSGLLALTRGRILFTGSDRFDHFWRH